MTTGDASIAHYYSLHPIEYQYVEKFCISQTFSPYDMSVEVILRKSVTEDIVSRIYLKFEGVRNLHLNPGEFQLQLPLLQIESIKDNQWAGLRYKVVETEEDMLSFYCRSFSACTDGGEPFGGDN